MKREPSVERPAEALDGHSGANPAQSPDVVVLSPHLDDAALSMGALIARHAAEGCRVEVWTFFTRGPPIERVLPGRVAFGDYATRCAEDERALLRLGASHRWLGFRERIWGDPPLTNDLHVFRTPKVHDGFVNLGPIQDIVVDVLDRPGARIYAPLGVGNHHDHVEVALAALRVVLARDAFDRVSFYEDFYATDAASRRRHFVTRRRSWAPFAAPGWASPALAGLVRLGAWSARGPGVDGYLPAAASLEWTPHAEPVGSFESVKVDAVADYCSQVATVGGMKRLSPFLRRAHAALGGELIWRASRPAGQSTELQPSTLDRSHVRIGK